MIPPRVYGSRLAPACVVSRLLRSIARDLVSGHQPRALPAHFVSWSCVGLRECWALKRARSLVVAGALRDAAVLSLPPCCCSICCTRWSAWRCCAGRAQRRRACACPRLPRFPSPGVGKRRGRRTWAASAASACGAAACAACACALAYATARPRSYRSETCCDRAQTDDIRRKLYALTKTTGGDNGASDACVSAWLQTTCSVCAPEAGVAPDGLTPVCGSVCDKLHAACSDEFFALDGVRAAARVPAGARD